MLIRHVSSAIFENAALVRRHPRQQRCERPAAQQREVVAVVHAHSSQTG